MTTKSTFLLLGVCIGAAAPLIAKAAKPLAAYALAGGMLAYEAFCDAIESSRETCSDRFQKNPPRPEKRQEERAGLFS